MEKGILSLLPLLCYGQFHNVTIDPFHNDTTDPFHNVTINPFHNVTTEPFHNVNIDLLTDAGKEIESCEANAEGHPVNSRLAKLACIHAYYASLGADNLTDSEWDLFRNASKTNFGFEPPPTGFRVRKEIRTLSEQEWSDFVDAIKTMYQTSTLRTFGLFHGSSFLRYHKGAAFLPWHRVFLTHFEEEMRKINPEVALPYWDYTLDNNITLPSKSVVWSDCFLGNGEGSLISGPFKNFYGGLGALISRDIGRACASKLVNKIDIIRLHEYCSFKEITTSSGPYFEQNHNLELLHDGVHDWIGGDMGTVTFSAFDPVFYIHHAFIDYIWEKFREHQKENCGEIDIENDYRPNDDLGQESIGPQGPDEPMWGYRHLLNKHGLSKNWTKFFYRYEPAPSCPNNCQGEYLYCDKSAEPDRYPEGLCLTRTIDACKQQEKREKRADDANLIPQSPCSAGSKLKGLAGDGRSKDLSEEENRDILQHFQIFQTGGKCPEGGSNSSGSVRGGVVGFCIAFILILIIAGIMIHRGYANKVSFKIVLKPTSARVQVRR